jgi:hypothetical protein
MSIAITGSIGLIGLAAVSGAGLAAGTAALCRPPARKRIIARWAADNGRYVPWLPIGIPPALAMPPRPAPAGYPTDGVAQLSPTPSTGRRAVSDAIDIAYQGRWRSRQVTFRVDGVADRFRLWSMA